MDSVQIGFLTRECCNCGIVFGLPDALNRNRIGKMLFCPGCGKDPRTGNDTMANLVRETERLGRVIQGLRGYIAKAKKGKERS